MSTVTILLIVFLAILIVGFVSSMLHHGNTEDDSYRPVCRDDMPSYHAEAHCARERCHYINKRNHRNDEKIARHKANQYPW